jgi:hypothetical protein
MTAAPPLALELVTVVGLRGCGMSTWAARHLARVPARNTLHVCLARNTLHVWSATP